MSVKIVSPKTELQVLRGMVHKNKKIAGMLLAGCNETYFESDQSKKIYRFIKSYMAETGEVPTFRNIIEDPAIDRSARVHFRDSVASITSVDEAKSTLKILNRYRQLRGIYELGVEIQRRLDDGRVVMDEMLEDFSTRLTEIRTTQAAKSAFTHLGKNNSSTAAVKELLYNDETDDVIPTGIREYDEESGGFLRGSLVTIGASSGGGKSLLGATQLAINMAERGYKVTLVPLEMTEQEMLARIIANLAGLDSTLIIQHKLATGERDKAFEVYERWVRKVKKRGGRLSIFKPDGEVSIEDVFTALHTVDTDVIIVDYISLLAGTDGDDSWQQLGSIARKGKVHAGSTRRVVVMLCQVNEDGKIRYARAISEHSNASWIWVTPQEEREKPIGRIKIEQPKARNSRSFPFEVGFEWAHMRVVSVDALPPEVGDVGTPDKKGASKKPLKNYATDL